MRSLSGCTPGEKPNQPFPFLFNASLKVDFQGSRDTSNGGLILVRELDERLGLSELIDQHLTDARDRELLARAAAESVYSGVGVRRGVAKSRPQMGQFWAVLVWMADRGECSRRKSLYSIRTSETGVLWCSFQSQNGNSGLSFKHKSCRTG